MRQQLIKLIRKAFTELKSKEGYLFDCSIEENVEYDARKLHEVCLNHKLANYLEKLILPILQEENEKFFVDIEFNREGLNNKFVRPDIIIHNRKSGDEKHNFLVMESVFMIYKLRIRNLYCYLGAAAQNRLFSA